MRHVQLFQHSNEDETPETQINGEKVTITPGEAQTPQEAETPKERKLKLPTRHWE